ncbi:nucleolar protein 56-like [Ostrea edulis]|uniref:nucleolar protein 56-like n=1 Tax=Ostrea edulis TaxID=37623 RepID=UPI0024AF20BB|nr:nucleolar protein 56-like [Ostrea edulis]
MPQSVFILFEHASGYGLFRVKEFEEVATFIPEVEKSIVDVSKFQSIVKLVAFAPFKSGTNALDNMNSISEGIVHEDLHVFLESNVPKGGKKDKVVVGVSDSKIGAAITEELGIKCSHIGVAPEVIRGIRHHFPNMVKGLTEVSSGKAQLGLGHSYSRAKVKFNVNRADNMIIQSISLMDQLDKNINTFSMRIREWYSYHFPELVKIITDNYLYAKVVQFIGNRKEFTVDSLEQLEELVMDSGKAQAILEASRSSMGMDISPIDLMNIEAFTAKVISLTEYRRGLANYLRSKMTQVAPNLGTLIGDQVGARLIAHAGSLTNLAKYPASTVQILGAEKALFRAIKTKGNTPKYGLIFHSTFIGRAGAKNKGRISRYLANKCSIASRIDCFSEFPTHIFGDHLKQQVEDRLKFLDTGEAPQKNIDVMKEAAQEASVIQAKMAKKEKKKKKKEKRKSSADDTLDTTQEADTTQEMDVSQEEPKKKKKKRKSEAESMNTTQELDTTQEEEPPKKKKKKPKVEAEEEEEEELQKKKKKKKNK